MSIEALVWSPSINRHPIPAAAVGSLAHLGTTTTTLLDAIFRAAPAHRALLTLVNYLSTVQPHSMHFVAPGEQSNDDEEDVEGSGGGVAMVGGTMAARLLVQRYGWVGYVMEAVEYIDGHDSAAFVPHAHTHAYIDTHTHSM